MNPEWALTSRTVAVLRYVDASSDAEKVSMFGMRVCDLDHAGLFVWQATDINPGYARAWGRLAVAKAVGLSFSDAGVERWNISATSCHNRD